MTCPFRKPWTHLAVVSKVLTKRIPVRPAFSGLVPDPAPPYLTVARVNDAGPVRDEGLEVSI